MFLRDAVPGPLIEGANHKRTCPSALISFFTHPRSRYSFSIRNNFLDCFPPPPFSTLSFLFSPSGCCHSDCGFRQIWLLPRAGGRRALSPSSPRRGGEREGEIQFPKALFLIPLTFTKAKAAAQQCWRVEQQQQQQRTFYSTPESIIPAFSSLRSHTAAAVVSVTKTHFVILVEHKNSDSPSSFLLL